MTRWLVSCVLLLGFCAWMAGPATKLARAADDKKPAAKEGDAAKDKSSKSETTGRHASKEGASKSPSGDEKKEWHGRHKGFDSAHHRAGSPEMKKPSAEELFKQFDTDKNGTLSQEEFAAGMKKLEERWHERMQAGHGPQMAHHHHFGHPGMGWDHGYSGMHRHHGPQGKGCPWHPGMHGGFGHHFAHHFGHPGFGHHFGHHGFAPQFGQWGHHFGHPGCGPQFGPWGRSFGHPGFEHHFGHPGFGGPGFGHQFGQWGRGEERRPEGEKHRFTTRDHGRPSEHADRGHEGFPSAGPSTSPSAGHRSFGGNFVYLSGPPSAAGLMERFDKNKDGKLTKDEVPEGLWEHLSQTGAVKDGAVTKEGLEASFKKMQEHFQQRTHHAEGGESK
jgi:hypothetical protein